MRTNIEQHRHFKDAHKPGSPLLLFNVWDAGSARVLAQAGAEAVATGNWSVAAAQGYDDGQHMPFDFVLQIVDRITQTVDLPLSVDFESGYTEDIKTLAENTAQLIATGAIGVNFEDQAKEPGDVRSIEDQVQRVHAVRQAANDAGRPLFINARTDVFLNAEPDRHTALADDAIRRGRAYKEAGADGFFVPGLTQLEVIERVCRDVDLPVNVMFKSNTHPIDALAACGVARISCGPLPYQLAQADLREQFAAFDPAG